MEVSGRYRARKALALVRAVAKGRIAGVAAAAEGNGRPPAQPERFAFLIHDLEIAFNAQRTVIENSHFCSYHRVLPFDGLRITA